MRSLVRAHAAEEDEVVAAGLAPERVHREVERVRAVRDPGEVRLRLALVHRDGDELRLRRELEHLLVEPAGLPVERPVHRVAEGHVHEPAEGEAEHPRVVVEDVELVGLPERMDRVLHLPVRVPDPLARRRVEDGLEPSAGLRVARCEERHVVPRVDEPVGEQCDHPLGPAVRLRRHREPDGANEPYRIRPTHLGNRDMPALDGNASTSAVRADALDAQPVEPARELVGHRRDEALPLAIGLDPEQHADEEDRRARGPGLRSRGGRVGDRERCLVARVAREDLGQRPVEVRGGLDERPTHATRLGDVAVAREPPRGERRVVRPDRPVVVADRVERRGVARHRPDPQPVHSSSESSWSTTAAMRSGGTIPLQSRWPMFERASRRGRFAHRARARRSHRAPRPRTPRRNASGAHSPRARAARRARGSRHTSRASSASPRFAS